MMAVQVFNYTGAQQTFNVPAGVTSVTIECWGASGGATDYGIGGLVVGTEAVSVDTPSYCYMI